MELLVLACVVLGLVAVVDVLETVQETLWAQALIAGLELVAEFVVRASSPWRDDRRGICQTFAASRQSAGPSQAVVAGTQLQQNPQKTNSLRRCTWSVS